MNGAVEDLILGRYGPEPDKNTNWTVRCQTVAIRNGWGDLDVFVKKQAFTLRVIASHFRLKMEQFFGRKYYFLTMS